MPFGSVISIPTGSVGGVAKAIALLVMDDAVTASPDADASDIKLSDALLQLITHARELHELPPHRGELRVNPLLQGASGSRAHRRHGRWLR